MADSAPAAFSLRREGATALRNGLKLATSLALTWGIALVITFKLPRYLGPLALGWYRYGFEYAATLAVFLHFGVDTYISREIAVRPKHASDFFGGIVIARVLLMVPLFALGWWHLGHRIEEEKIAAVLTYIRHEWGQAGSVVDAQTVKVVRAATAGRTRPWTNDELTALAGGRGGQRP